MTIRPILFGLGAALLVGGVLLIGSLGAWRISLTPTPTPSGLGELGISEVLLGTPRTAEGITSHTPPLRQDGDYSTEERIAVRVVTNDTTIEPFSVSVRLLTAAGAPVPLSPDTFTVSPREGISGYCCWTIENPGRYTFQLFRPDGGVTALPLRIVASPGQAQPRLPVL